MLNNAVSFSLDVYQSKTDQLLLRQAALAFTGVPQTWNNIGSLQNNGIEFEMTTFYVKNKSFEWKTNANISRNENKILELGSESQLLNQGERTELYLNKVGAPLVQFLGYKTDGVWISQTQISESKLTSALANVFVPGGLKIVDINNDGKIDISDRTVIGNPYPDFIWGITNSFKFKGFDFSFMLQGSQGGQLINGDPNYNEIKRTNANFNTTSKWLSPLNPGDGKTPYYLSGFNWMLTDYVVEDASYQSLREVIAGYTIPKNLTKKLHLGSVRIYATAQNLLFLTAKGYRGLNPEAVYNNTNGASNTVSVYNTPLIDGYQRGSYPMNKSIRFGIDLSF
jgi:TonB-dependent starch-binding outer membrane protein SusC